MTSIVPPPSEPIGYLIDVKGLDETTSDFRSALFTQASEAGFEPSYVAAVIAKESGFKPWVVNPNGKAAGLIQFWEDFFPAVAMRAGRPDIQWSDLPKLTAAEQVPLVIAYFQGTPIDGRRGLSPTDYALATFMPAFVGAPASTVLGKQGSADQLRTLTGANTGLSLGKVYEQNASLDRNGDGVITVGDVGAGIEAIVSQGRQRPLVEVFGSDPPGARGGALVAGVGLVFFCPSCGAHSRTVNVGVE